MFIKQISIFVENKPGRISEIISLLGDNNIDIAALSLADTAKYGVLRIIVDNPEKTVSLLEADGVAVKVNNVIGIAVENTPGGLAKALTVLTRGGITIEYIYAFVCNSEKGALVVIRTDNKEKAVEMLLENGITILKETDVFNK
jgi:hypothetical protein